MCGCAEGSGGGRGQGGCSEVWAVVQPGGASHCPPPVPALNPAPCTPRTTAGIRAGCCPPPDPCPLPPAPPAPQDTLADVTLRTHNASALGSSLLACMALPWTACLLFYSVLHFTYVRTQGAGGAGWRCMRWRLSAVWAACGRGVGAPPQAGSCARGCAELQPRTWDCQPAAAHSPPRLTPLPTTAQRPARCAGGQRCGGAVSAARAATAAPGGAIPIFPRSASWGWRPCAGRPANNACATTGCIALPLPPLHPELPVHDARADGLALNWGNTDRCAVGRWEGYSAAAPPRERCTSLRWL